METKLAKLKNMWAAGDYRGALKLAASWPRLGAHKGRIQQGWAAATNESIYRQMGKDPAALYRAALAAVAERYALPLPTGLHTPTSGAPTLPNMGWQPV